MSECMRNWVPCSTTLPPVGQPVLIWDGGTFCQARLAAGQVEKWWITADYRILPLADVRCWAHVCEPEQAEQEDGMKQAYLWRYHINPYPIGLKRSHYVPVYVALFYKEFPDGRCLLPMHEPGEEYPHAYGEVFSDLCERAEIICRMLNREAA